MLALLLQACVGTGGGLDDVDQSGNAPVTVMAGETVTEGTDERIILSAVVSAPPSGDATTQVPWTNKENGDSGTVSYISETEEGQSVCRSFIVSKQSYDGINQLSGKACRAKGGIVWTLKSLDPRE